MAYRNFLKLEMMFEKDRYISYERGLCYKISTIRIQKPP